MSGYGIGDEHWAGGRRPSMRPPPRIQSRVVVAVVAVAVGFLVAVQALGTPGALSRLAAERPEDLTRILADLNDEADRLARQVSALRVRLLRYRGSARADELALRDAQETLADLEVVSGRAPVEGPGLEVAIEDPGGRVGWDALLDLVQELRDAGAEAIELNDARVVASTWLAPADGGVLVDGGRVSPPYRFLAIGPPDVLEEAMAIPGGPLSVIGAQPGVVVQIRPAERLSLPAAPGDVSFRYARPSG